MILCEGTIERKRLDLLSETLVVIGGKWVLPKSTQKSITKSHILSLYRFNPSISDLNDEGTSESDEVSTVSKDDSYVLSQSRACSFSKKKPVIYPFSSM